MLVEVGKFMLITLSWRTPFHGTCLWANAATSAIRTAGIVRVARTGLMPSILAQDVTSDFYLPK
jgi:hypothetical protein